MLHLIGDILSEYIVIIYVLIRIINGLNVLGLFMVLIDDIWSE